MRQQKWNQDKVVAAIQRWVSSGRPISRILRENRPLYRAGVNHFGNWKSAVEAAGYEPRIRRRWSEARVIKEILAWSADPFAGCLSQHDSGLAIAAKKYFGSVEEALELLDIDVKGRNWTRKKVIDTIQSLYLQGEPARLIGLGNVRLYYVAKRKFGSWKDAMEAAGLAGRYSVRENLRSWGPEEVIQAIRAWHAQHGNLRGIWHQDQGLYSVAKKHFGNWSKALRAAGIPITRRRWSRARIAESMRKLHARHGSVSSRDFGKHDPPLVTAAYRYFGTWKSALDAAGLSEPPMNAVSNRNVG
ncbi:MAG: hypothetical protein KDA83_19050 [Planctomycetales bacterium]|nr:hypothetical protein [Planctomycetales bacterium]